MDRLPPHNLEAEQSVLGSLLIDQDAVAQVCDRLIPEAFYIAANATLYRALLALWKARRPANVVILTELLERRGKLDEVGGAAYISHLLASTPTALYVNHYADIVLNCAKRRALIDSGTDLVRAAYADDLPIDDAVGMVRRSVEPFATEPITSDGGLFADTMDGHRQRVEDRWHGRLDEHVVPTGIPSVDRLLLGGFRGGDLVFIGGRPGSGKTSWMLQLAQRAARLTKKRSLIVELEMSPEALRDRAIAAEAGVPFRTAYDQVGDQAARERWLEASAALEWVPVDIQRLTTTDRIAAYCESAMASEFPVGAVFIDHIDYLQDRIQTDSAERRTAELTRACKRIATGLNVPTVVLSQLNREVEAHAPFTPALKHFRQSGAIEQDADHAFLLYRRKYYVDKQMLEADSSRDYITASPLHRVELIVAKNRNGEVRTIELGWEPDSMTFREVMAA